MKDTPIQILDHIYYRDEASSQTNKFRIASNDSQRMLDKNFSICFSSSNTKYLFIALNEKTDTKEIIQRNMSSRVIYLSNQKKTSILSCEEDEEECITRIFGKIYDLRRRLSSYNF